MSRQNLRTALAGLTLAAILTATPPLAAAEEGGRTFLPNLAATAWQWVVEVWMGSGEQADISLQIDPDGVTAPPEETAGGGSMGEIGLQIDPNG